MSTLCAALLVAAMAVPQPAVRTVLVPSPEARLAVVQAHVAAPDQLDAKSLAAWMVLGRSLLDGTQAFGRERFWSYASQAGVPPTVDVSPDLIRISVTVPNTGIDLAAQLLEEAMMRPRLDDGLLTGRILEVLAWHPDAWSASLWGARPDARNLRSEDVRRVHAQAFRPERIVLVFGGELAPGAVDAALAGRFQAPPTPIRERVRIETGPAPAKLDWPSDFPTSVFALVSPNPLGQSGPAASQALAVFALGVGKGSAMHRVLREQNAWSYRQEALLWPTAKGWVPHVRMERKEEAEAGDWPEQMRNALLQDVEAWTEVDRERALAMAQAALRRGLPVSPFWVDASGPAGVGLSDRCALAGYAALVNAPSIEVLVGAMTQVDLVDLKASAKSLLEQAQAQSFVGSPE